MPPPRKLKSIVNSAKTDIEIIQKFAIDADSALSTQKPVAFDPPLSEKEKENFDRLVNSLRGVSTSNDGSNNRFTLKLDTSPRLVDVFLKLAFLVKQRSFLAEMTLSYLASHLEAFIKDLWIELLQCNPDMLRSNATLTYAEVASCRSVKELRMGLVEREVDSLGYGSIDDTREYFLKRMNIDLSDFSKWPQLREFMYRRNLIVHNRGMVNPLYRKKVSYTGPSGVLKTDMHYVSETSQALLEFIEFAHSSIRRKYSKKRSAAVKK